jgi:hypothetical protein
MSEPGAKQSCRTCAFLLVPENGAGRRVPRKQNCYPCTYEIQPHALPDSVVRSYGFKWPPPKTWMPPDGGTGCVCYKEFAK